MRRHISRRSFLKAGTALGVAGAAIRIDGARRARQQRLVEAALAASTTAPATMSDIEHVVVLMQENRSFDHFFGCYRGVAGFSDPDVLVQPGHDDKPVWYQYGWAPGDSAADPGHYLLPFHLDTSNDQGDAVCVDDPTHAWIPQHQSWNDGALDGFVSSHIASDGVAVGPHTMGYYTRSDIGFYYDLADAFTLCDNYHHSVLGPTTPNRLFLVSATIDAQGQGGGPVTSNPGGYVPLTPSLDGQPSFTWQTMADVLQEAGVSWKAYQPPGSQITDELSDNVFLYFKEFQDPSSPMFANGVVPTFPGDFTADVAAGTLPQVSWIMSMGVIDEHPPSPVIFGDLAVTQQVLATLLSNPAVWEKTVLFVTYDENGGFFDHIPPPTPGPMCLSASDIPSGDAYNGEYLTAAPTIGGWSGPEGTVFGPVGLGFRVPTLVLSPFSVGGYVSHETFDHTSLLRFVEARFGTPVPNLSAWRRSVTGDLTSAINFAGGTGGVSQSLQTLVADAGIVATTPIVTQTADAVAEDCPVDSEADEIGVAGNPPAYPISSDQSMPSQEPGSAPSPSGPVTS
ncbi:MAG TPA: alkaline phosphatase family protein [Acidimicrobiales bacterium]|nr:alkaline phosphatase family protein [Acidimicrobiales bacterium]